MWLWSVEIVSELLRRELVDAALALDDRTVAARYEGPPLAELGDAALMAAAALVCPDVAPAPGTVTAAT